MYLLNECIDFASLASLVLYECVKTYVMKRKEDPYAFVTPSLRKRKFNFSCCVCYAYEAIFYWKAQEVVSITE